MLEVIGNLWFVDADARCITTNGVVKSNGELVMGAGIAKQAKLMRPGISKKLGEIVSVMGNHVVPVPPIEPPLLISFPVKHHWREPADLELIERSALELLGWINDINALRVKRDLSLLETIVMPRPGCGNGQQDWGEVKSILAPILDDRFVVVEIMP